MRRKINQLTLSAAFAAMMSLCSWITIPAAVPFTMQTFAMFVGAALLSPNCAAASMLTYLALGSTGVPVFSGFSAGLGTLFGVTGGYILGFVPASYLISVSVKRFGRSTAVLFAAMTAGLAVCYIFGTVYFMFLYADSTGPISTAAVLSKCVLPFLIPDAAKMAAAVYFVRRIERVILC